MAISRLSSQDAQNSSITTSVAVAYPAATTLGNLLIASVWTNTTSASIAISGFTVRQTSSSAGNSLTLLDKIADGTETTITVTGGNNNMRLHIYEYTGNLTSSFVDDSNTNLGTSGTTAPSTTLVTSNTNDLIFMSFSTSTTVTAPSVDSGFSLLQTGPGAIRLFDAELIVSATGSYTTNASWTTTAVTRNAGAAYKATPPASANIITNLNNYMFVKVGDGMSATEKIK